MNRSTDRILTTHTGSLVRPPALRQLLLDREAGHDYDRAALDAMVRRCVSEVVRRQVDTGLASVNDGEMGKVGFANYVRERLNGFDGAEEERPVMLDERTFPVWAANRRWRIARPACEGPVSWKDFAAVEHDIETLASAAAAAGAPEVFMTAVSPGTIANFFPNRFYPDRAAYLQAIVEVMRREYAAIVDAGFVLQLDSPDLVLRDFWFPDDTLEDFRAVVRENIEALNQAVAGLPAGRMRVHVCWGAGERPHAHDIPLRALVDLLLTARPEGLSIVAANARHEHEYRVWRDEVHLPTGKVLIPGIIDSTTNIIEHPEVVAERLVRYAGIVGRERLIGGVDCGFGTNATNEAVDGDVAFAKLRSLVEGAALASKELW